MNEQQAQIDALPGTWRRETLHAAHAPAWTATLGASEVRLHCLYRLGPSLRRERFWYTEVLCGALDQLDDETVQASGDTAADALRALAVEARRIADAHAADAAELELLLSGQEVKR